MNKQMVSMKLPKMSKKEAGEKMTAAYPGEREEYPYGLRLSLNENEIKKLDGLFGMDVEGEGMMQAKFKIVDKRSHEMKGGKTERSLEIQITDLACKSAPKKGDEVSDGAWYDNMKKGK